MVTIILLGETIKVTDEQFDVIQDLYVKCHSCGGYDEGRSPEHGEYMCEDCIG